MTLMERQCQTCRRSFNGGPRACYCPGCRIERRKEADRKYKRNKKNGLTRDLGSTDNCIYCKKSYTVENGLQKMCPECKPERYAAHDRETSIAFYHEHKASINPIRNERRRIGTRKCEICQKEYETNNSSLTCSVECSRLRKNQKWNEWYHRKVKGDSQLE